MIKFLKFGIVGTDCKSAQRFDAFGNEVTRNGLGNHTKIIYDLK